MVKFHEVFILYFNIYHIIVYLTLDMSYFILFLPTIIFRCEYDIFNIFYYIIKLILIIIIYFNIIYFINNYLKSLFKKYLFQILNI